MGTFLLLCTKITHPTTTTKVMVYKFQSNIYFFFHILFFLTAYVNACDRCDKNKEKVQTWDLEEDYSDNGVDICSHHPNHFCATVELAESCGQNAVKLCEDRKLGAFSNFVENEEENILEGDMECTKGPRYWCSDRKIAVKCGKLDYCRQRGLIS